jgi:hypothetical protein
MHSVYLTYHNAVEYSLLASSLVYSHLSVSAILCVGKYAESHLLRIVSQLSPGAQYMYRGVSFHHAAAKHNRSFWHFVPCHLAALQFGGWKLKAENSSV